MAQFIKFKMDSKEARLLIRNMRGVMLRRRRWFLEAAPKVLANWQQHIWRTNGGPEFDWVKMGHTYGTKASTRDRATGLTLLRLMTRGLYPYTVGVIGGEWRSIPESVRVKIPPAQTNPSMVLRDTGRLRSGIGVLSSTGNKIFWGHPDKKYADVDQMDGVEKGVMSRMVSSTIQLPNELYFSFPHLRGPSKQHRSLTTRPIISHVPARPVVYANDMLADILIANLNAFLFDSFDKNRASFYPKP